MTEGIRDIDSLKINGIDSETMSVIKDLLAVRRARYAKNRMRTLYTDTEQAFKDIGIAMPPQLRRMNYVLGWAEQAVRKPSMRSQFEGLRAPGIDDPFELRELFAANDFAAEFGQAVYSAGKHGAALMTVAHGVDGEPDALIQAHGAEDAGLIWDPRKRRLSAALTIHGTDSQGRITGFTVWLTDRVIICDKHGSAWDVEDYHHSLGRCPAVVVRHSPSLSSPLGRSRLTNAVMRLNDLAVRTLARMEGNAEFYSSPQVALLGVDYEAFNGENGGMSRDDKFRLAMDRVMALTKDEDGDRPVLQQLQQATMTPHSDMMRTVATAFSAETGLPPSALGVVHDNPSSAEAIRAAYHEMLIDVSYQNKYVLPGAIREVAALCLMVRDNTSVLPDGFWGLDVTFKDPEFRSLSAEADAVQKLAASMDQMANYKVLLERIFSHGEVERIQADKRRADGAALLQMITNRQPTETAQEMAERQGAGDATDTGSNDSLPADSGHANS